MANNVPLRGHPCKTPLRMAKIVFIGGGLDVGKDDGVHHVDEVHDARGRAPDEQDFLHEALRQGRKCGGVVPCGKARAGGEGARACHCGLRGDASVAI